MLTRPVRGQAIFPGSATAIPGFAPDGKAPGVSASFIGAGGRAGGGVVVPLVATWWWCCCRCLLPVLLLLLLLLLDMTALITERVAGPMLDRAHLPRRGRRPGLRRRHHRPGRARAVRPWAGWLHCFRNHSNSSMLIHPAQKAVPWAG